MERSEKLFEELNEYYEFTKVYVKKKVPVISKEVDEDIIQTDNIKKELTNDFLKNEAIGVVVRESMKYLMANNKLTTDDINDLMDQQFSSKHLGCWLPALATKVEDKNRKRYYKNLLTYNGIEYMLCKEWYKEDRDIIVEWIKSKNK